MNKKNFRPFNQIKTVITHLDDVLTQSQTDQERFNLLEKYRQSLLKEYIKAAPDKTHFFSLVLNSLDGSILPKIVELPLKISTGCSFKFSTPTLKKKTSLKGFFFD